MTRASSWMLAPLALALFSLPAPAWAQSASDGEGDVCINSFERSQSLREDGMLLEARDALRTCSDAACPDFARTRCISWLDEVETAIPTVVVSAKGPDGGDVLAVRVTVDGKVAAESLDGKPIDLDPGAHTLLLEYQGHPSEELQILAKMGERNRVVEVTFAAPAAPPPPVAPPVAPPPDPEPTPTAPPPAPPDEADSAGPSPIFWVALGLGGAGLVVGAVTGGIAMSQGSDLQDRCPDNQCLRSDAEDDLNSANSIATVSTISFIAGGVLTAVGVVGLVVTMGGDEEEAAVRIEPVVGPGALGLRGSF